jgi:virginiamycin B lyase
VVKRTMLGKQPGFLAAGVGARLGSGAGRRHLARIDPQSGEVVTRVKVGDNLKFGDIDIGGGKIWLRTTDDQLFAVVDPKTNTVSARVGKAAGSGALRYSSKGVWTTAHDEHTLTWWPTSGKMEK